MGICSSVLDEPPPGGELSRLADKLVRLGCARTTVMDALRIFWRADKDGSGTIGLKEFAKMFQLRTQNAFLPRLLALFDVSGDGDIGALEFILCLAQFYNSSAKAHVYFTWRLFDQDDSGSMTMEEFENILSNTLSYTGKQKGFSAGMGQHGGATPDDNLGDRIVMSGRAGQRVRVKGFRQIIKEADLDHNGVITLDEFQILASNATHIVAPAFELWTALELHSKPCWRVKEELKASGKLSEVQEMLSPKARKAMGMRSPAAGGRDRHKQRGRRMMGDNRPTQKHDGHAGGIAGIDSSRLNGDLVLDDDKFASSARDEREREHHGERRESERGHRHHKRRHHTHRQHHSGDHESDRHRHHRRDDGRRHEGHRGGGAPRRSNRREMPADPGSAYYGQPSHPINASQPGNNYGQYQNDPMGGGHHPRAAPRGAARASDHQDALLAQLEADLNMS